MHATPTTILSLPDAEVLRVEEAILRVPMAQLGADPALVAANRAWLEPTFVDPATDSFPLCFQSWILRFSGLNIVVDPCNGNGRERPAMPHFHHQDTPYIERFAATGVSPENVDLVFCTHLHCDHCGWNTKLQGGRWTPTFPNARYIFVRREVERWNPHTPGYVPVDYNVGVFEEAVQPILDAGLAELVGDAHTIMAGLDIEAAYGHSAGHSILHLATGGTEVFFTGDAFHHPLQVHDPRLYLGGCDDLDMAIATRDRLRRTIASRDALMLPAHFPAPHAGKVVQQDEGFAFVPFRGA